MTFKHNKDNIWSYHISVQNHCFENLYIRGAWYDKKREMYTKKKQVDTKSLSIFTIPAMVVLLGAIPATVFAQGENPDWTLRIYVPSGQNDVIIHSPGGNVNDVPTNGEGLVTIPMKGADSPAGQYEVCIPAGGQFVPNCTSFNHTGDILDETHTIFPGTSQGRLGYRDLQGSQVIMASLANQPQSRIL